jgi:hypothetical protein
MAPIPPPSTVKALLAKVGFRASAVTENRARSKKVKNFMVDFR